MLKLTLSLLTLFSATASAAETTATVTLRQVFEERAVAIGESNGTVAVGEEFLATFESKKQCVLTVTDVREKLVTLPTETCRYRHDMNAGMVLEKSLLPTTLLEKPIVPNSDPQRATPTPTPKPAVQESAAREKQFALGLAASLSSGMRADDGNITGVSGTFSSEFKFENGFTLSVESRSIAQNSWGHVFGASYDFERKVKSLTLTGSGSTTTVTPTSNAATMSMLALEAGLIYRWIDFYIPFGLNYSVPKFTPASGFTGTFTCDGGLGAQFGFGYYLNEKLAIEFISRASNVRLKVTSGTTNFDHGLLSYSNSTFGIKGIF